MIAAPFGAVTMIVMFGAVVTLSDPRVQVTTPEAWPQVHPEPLALTNEAVTGSVSVTVIEDAVPGPALATASV